MIGLSIKEIQELAEAEDGLRRLAIACGWSEEGYKSLLAAVRAESIRHLDWTPETVRRIVRSALVAI